MTAAGRTSWWPCDAAEHDRELIVELGDEFGPAGPLVMRVLKDLAGQQSLSTGGHVRTGFRVLAKKCHIDRDLAHQVVQRAAAIGALDDLEVEDDGRRFSCRLSGWDADFKRGKETLKKRAQRAAQDEDTSPDPGDTVPAQGDTSPECPPTGQDRTEEEEEDTRASARPTAVHPQLAEVLGRLRVVDGLAAPGDDATELAVNQALQRCERDGADALDLADAAVSQALEYSSRGPLRASAGSLMHGLLDRRKTNNAAQLAAKSAEVRAAFEGRGAGARRRAPSNLDRAAALEAEVAAARGQQA